MKEGRSRILIIRSLTNFEKRTVVQESTIKKVLALILDAHAMSGEEAAEQMATDLMDMVDSSQTEQELLNKLAQMKDFYKKPPTIERVLLMHEEFARGFSDTTTESITQIIESTRINNGHFAAEAKAKEIRKLIESDISEAELLDKISGDRIL